MDYSFFEIAHSLDLQNEAVARKRKFNCMRKLMDIVPNYPELKTLVV